MVRTRPYHLLIVDDDAGFRLALRQVFEPLFELVEAESGEEAVAIVEYRPVDVALLDMHMDVMTGIETIRVLKRVNSAAPCILITSDPSDEVRRDACEADAFTVLRKPVTRRELVATVSTALEDAYDDGEFPRVP